MSQSGRTAAFLVVAIASVAVAVGVHRSYQPVSLANFSDVGQEFFPDFTDPNEATGLRVASYDSETGKTEAFSVEFKDGLWRIPTHHNYPADAQDRLSQTAASMIGVKRQAMAEQSVAAQKRHRVLDPLDREVAGTEGRGDRITLFKDEQPIVDFIVGDKVEGEESLYYVRRADEDRIYTADLGNLSVSTKFADWIHKDILDVNRNSIKELIVNRYHVDEAEGRIVSEGQLVLKQEEGGTAWNLEGLNAETEAVKTSEVNNLLTALDDLEITGVRPKPPGLSAGLKGGTTISIDPFVERDLALKGFYIANGQFISNEGEVNVGTDEGVIYILGFGEEFSGTEIDVQVGRDSSANAEQAEKTETPDAEQKTSEEGADNQEADQSDEGDSKPGVTKSRYLFVSAHFDKNLLGGMPLPPVKPQPPAASETQESEAGGDEANDSASANVDLQKRYEEDLKDYEIRLEVYEIQKKEYDERFAKGEERVAELNRRFADWYYVISDDVFARLKLKREDLVEPKEADATPELEMPALPEIIDAATIENLNQPAAETAPEQSQPPVEPMTEPEAAPGTEGGTEPVTEPAASQTPATETPAMEPVTEPAPQPSAEESPPAQPEPVAPQAESGAEPPAESSPAAEPSDTPADSTPSAEPAEGSAETNS